MADPDRTITPDTVHWLKKINNLFLFKKLLPMPGFTDNDLISSHQLLSMANKIAAPA
jgi:hypothetical protein